MADLWTLDTLYGERKRAVIIMSIPVCGHRIPGERISRKVIFSPAMARYLISKKTVCRENNGIFFTSAFEFASILIRSEITVGDAVTQFGNIVELKDVC